MTQPDITDADREAAADYWAKAHWGDADWHIISTAIRDGRSDTGDLVQAFARHRQAADRAGYERGVRASAGVADAFDTFDRDVKISASNAATAIAITTQILNLIPGGDDA